MLVLSRQRDQSVMIGDDIEVRVVDVRGDKVRLGFIAPRDVSVHRKEVYDEIRRENRAAAQVRPEDLSGLEQPKPATPSPLPKVPAPVPPVLPAPVEPKSLEQMTKAELLAEQDLELMDDNFDRAIEILQVLKRRFPKQAT
jgi:carbon storage regulator